MLVCDGKVLVVGVLGNEEWLGCEVCEVWVILVVGGGGVLLKGFWVLGKGGFDGFKCVVFFKSYDR